MPAGYILYQSHFSLGKTIALPTAHIFLQPNCENVFSFPLDMDFTISRVISFLSLY